MRYYRQHPIALLGTLLESLAVAILGLGLALMTGQLLPLVLVLAALAWAVWGAVRWATFVVQIEGRQVRLRTLRGFAVTERIVPVLTPGGLRLRQNVLGWMLDYGVLRIEVFGSPMRIPYITPFSILKSQIEDR